MFSKTILSFVSFLACAAPMLKATTITGVADLAELNDDKLNVYGPATLKNVNVKTLRVAGPLKFNNLTVQDTAKLFGPMEKNKGTGTFGTLTVKGPVDVQNIECKQALKITGPTTLSHAQVGGKTTVIGTLKASDSSFKNICVTAPKVELTDCSTGNIVIKKNNSGNTSKSFFGWLFGWSSKEKQEPQKLILDGTTTINGTITFEAGNGTVVTKGNSVNIAGTISGATLQKK
ncbi:hypothetical protein K2X40_01825 [Candidatus Babeliales bacterium]|nr:hypothetical protein [Candidatus Babeliales bacterium]